METHQIWRTSRHNCHLSTADGVHPKTFMLPQAKAPVIPPLEVDLSLELYGTLTYALIISYMNKYNNIISALQTKMLVISWHILCIIMLHNSAVRISSVDTYDLSRAGLVLQRFVAFGFLRFSQVHVIHVVLVVDHGGTHGTRATILEKGWKPCENM